MISKKDKGKSLVMTSEEYYVLLYEKFEQTVADRFKDLVAEGKKIEAMKLLREHGLIDNSLD